MQEFTSFPLEGLVALAFSTGISVRPSKYWIFPPSVPLLLGQPHQFSECSFMPATVLRDEITKRPSATFLQLGESLMGR